MSEPIASLFDTAEVVASEGDPVREADMLRLLAQRYVVRYGNGIRYVGAPHVRSHAGFDARRTADFIAMDLWPSKGLCLHGHEVKVSRADWLNELKQPEKAGEFIPFMDYWWLVVSDEDIVRPGELPDGWGLMAKRGITLVVKHQAKRRTPAPMPKTMMAAFLRAVAKSSGEVS
jgi:hypothetical protein